MPRYSQHITGQLGCDINCRPYDDYHSPQCTYTSYYDTQPCCNCEPICACDSCGMGCEPKEPSEPSEPGEPSNVDLTAINELIAAMQLLIDNLREEYDASQAEYTLFSADILNQLNTINQTLLDLKQADSDLSARIDQLILDYKAADLDLENQINAINTNVTNQVNELEETLIVYINEQNNNSEVIEFKYRFNNINDTYTIMLVDLDGQTIIRANGTTDYSITIPVITSDIEEDLIGRTLTIRSNTDNYITVEAESGVTVNSLDALVLRRKASTISLVYIGNQEWDVFGELP